MLLICVAFDAAAVVVVVVLDRAMHFPIGLINACVHLFFPDNLITLSVA